MISAAAINTAYHQDETEAVEALLKAAPLSADARARIKTRARQMIQTVRDNRRRFGGVDKFLNEFGLTTREGIALMCLAEALLRIPDAATADKMIRDKIGSAEWDKHLGKTDDLFVNASTWALMLTGKVIADVDAEKAESASSVAGRLVSKLGEPVVRRAMLHAMKIMGEQFVMGRTIGEAVKRAEESEKIGYLYSYDMLGEGARTTEDAARYYKAYADAIDVIGKAAGKRGPARAPGISVKLSALHPRYEYGNRDKCVPELAEKLLKLAQKCAQYDIGLSVDAEEAHRLEISLDIMARVFRDASLGQWEGFGVAIQAYQKRCGKVIDFLAALSEETGRRMMVRLVKGAYWDSEVKYAQVNGLPGYPVFTRKPSTDVSYAANAAKLLSRRDVFYPMFATHNAYTVASVIEMAGNDQTGFEFQRLHGMGEPLYHQMVGSLPGQYPIRVYAPVGSHQDLLPYLVRRLLENGANSNFVNRLQNDKVPVDEMLTDPADYIASLPAKPHPRIPLPVNVFDDRANSAGVEFANGAVSDALIRAVEQHATTFQSNTIAPATETDVEQALTDAQAAFKEWNETPADARAACLERAADIMERDMAALLALCTREGGKTLIDGVAEVREAVDFCRYYAAEGRKHFDPAGHVLPGPTGESNRLSLEGRGVFLCVSPWNFPLAIFMGQVTAALMAGNTIIAKPASQTPQIARRAVDILHEAGIPAKAVIFVPASGSLTGRKMIPDARISGVCFTGSTETAQTINRALAARDGVIVPLIAETGGQNAMIADSSALPEQIVDDVITSAFRSAGQRCSALRVLFVQDGIADKVIDMLAGACRELTLGDPLYLSTDIGPVIDKPSLDILEAHAARMTAEAKLVAEVPTPANLPAGGHYFAPRAFELPSMQLLTREVFGPILHIIRFKAEEIDKVVDQINGTGYGLTFGVHTRIDHTMKELCRRVRAGNCYVNRSMIGAVVGVQPFGGMGLSGTGPKAGGPHYLPRFATERTITVNTTAAGGNTTLVSLGEE